LRGDAGEALDAFVEIETAIEALLITGEITFGALRVERHFEWFSMRASEAAIVVDIAVHVQTRQPYPRAA
jgi:hypothetical protein